MVTAQHLLDYLLTLQLDYDLTEINVYFYDYSEFDITYAQDIRLDTKYNKTVLVVDK